MSLDIDLVGPVFEEIDTCTCSDCGYVHEVSRKRREHYFEYNITHNLGAMAREAGIYYYLWRPEEIGIDKAFQLIDPLDQGLQILSTDPLRFEKFNASMYEDLVRFVETYLHACRTYPDATVIASR